MVSFEYVLKDREGIHARPAGVIVKTAKEFESDITIENKGKKVNCKGIFAVMSLAAKCGEKVIISAEGNDEKEAVEALSSAFEKNL
ncbi:HPr family phosphocarrier protein [Lachnospiraceae bacterium NSJ-143]|nr:HPr family phosphocarrier protein [Lachnospiraceae bacterium NSJ-143]